MLLVLGLSVAGCATNPVSGKRDFVLMSESQEVVIGKKSHQQILKQYGVYDNPQLAAYINRLGQKLAAKSHRSHLRFTFTLLDSPEVNAFALPGGYIYITRGILSYLNSEEELAGVLGHEIGHVTARHGVKQQSAAQVGGVVNIIAAIATGSKDVAQATNYVGSALISGYGRNHELEADRLGAEYLAKADYAPEHMLQVIGVLKDQEEFSKQRARDKGKTPSSYHGVFSTHPDNDSRLQEVVRAAKKYENPLAVQTDREEFMKFANGMVYGHSESQGIIRDNKFYHSDLNLKAQFPASWQLKNLPDKLLAISPDQSQLIQFLPGDKNATNPEAFLKKNFAQLQQGQRIEGNAFAGVTPLDTPWGKRPGRVAAISLNNSMYVLMAVGKQQVPSESFFDTLLSIDPLSKKDRKLAKSKRIKVVRARAGDTYAKLAKYATLEKYEVEQLRLLNADYPNGEPTAGELIKIVE